MSLSEKKFLKNFRFKRLMLVGFVTKMVKTQRGTPVVVLWFSKAQLPKMIHTGYENCSVLPFIPDPSRGLNVLSLVMWKSDVALTVAAADALALDILQKNAHEDPKNVLTVKGAILPLHAGVPSGIMRKKSAQLRHEKIFQTKVLGRR